LVLGSGQIAVALEALARRRELVCGAGQSRPDALEFGQHLCQLWIGQQRQRLACAVMVLLHRVPGGAVFGQISQPLHCKGDFVNAVPALAAQWAMRQSEAENGQDPDEGLKVLGRVNGL
jgi:hypothetical protein